MQKKNSGVQYVPQAKHKLKESVRVIMLSYLRVSALFGSVGFISTFWNKTNFKIDFGTVLLNAFLCKSHNKQRFLDVRQNRQSSFFIDKLIMK